MTFLVHPPPADQLISREQRSLWKLIPPMAGLAAILPAIAAYKGGISLGSASLVDAGSKDSVVTSLLIADYVQVSTVVNSSYSTPVAGSGKISIINAQPTTSRWSANFLWCCRKYCFRQQVSSLKYTFSIWWNFASETYTVRSDTTLQDFWFSWICASVSSVGFVNVEAGGLHKRRPLTSAK